MTRYVLILLFAASAALAQDAAPAAAPAPASAAPQEAEEEAEDDGQLIAVIAAAVAAVWQSEGRDSGFVVRRVRRVQNSTARSRAARDEQIFSHF